MDQTFKYLLNEKDIPKVWYNLAADLPEPLPPVLHPGTSQPIGPDDLAPLFPMALIQQEVSTEREIEIPEQVREVYTLWRPTPLMPRAAAREGPRHPRPDLLQVRGDVSPAGSHKPNTAVAPGLLQQEGRHPAPRHRDRRRAMGVLPRLRLRALRPGVQVYMVRVSYDQKPYRRAADGGLRRHGASPAPRTTPSPAARSSPRTPIAPAASGIAISEAVEDAATARRHQVLPRQRPQPRPAPPDGHRRWRRSSRWRWPAITPTSSSAAAAAARNFAGIAFPFIGAQAPRRTQGPRIVAVEPAACPSLTKGKYAYDFGDTAQPHAARQDVHAGRTLHPAGHPRRRPAVPRHGAHGEPRSRELGLIEAQSRAADRRASRRGVQFARAEGIIPAPESTHAVRAAIDEALKREGGGQGPDDPLQPLGHGHFDMTAYNDYFSGKLRDLEYDPKELAMALAGLPSV